MLRLCDMEKHRIGRDLHDSIGQQLTGISLLSKAVEHRLRKSGHQEAESLMKISELVDDAIDQVRAVVSGMAPSELHNRDAAAAIRILCRRIQQIHDISCSFSNELPVPLADPDIAKNLYFIAAEAINNAIRHSRADQIDVRLRPGTSSKNGELIIRNNSNKCNLNSFSELTGIGLTGMHFRAEVMNGQLDILRYPDDYIGIVCSFQLP
ncbi:sensor histidine kinase [Tichowtungia aerotolerans]|uniref:Signal transduction histidine kinase subgroup 3 dimerisation and phosphoacceptor domain-containing protein n=1 Tax=Tichowtungia aerotolerans TaxID=2697043 RepID=A0A6P1MBM6_9BACT|nr:histidine kinase [Tichowtungia aerotolerans]QHI70503.1 hypothetical protein GT409_14000 [Tichowtungia aerotolerans]